MDLADDHRRRRDQHDHGTPHHLEAAPTVSIPAALVLAAALLYVAEAVGEIAAGVWYQAVWLPRIAGED